MNDMNAFSRICSYHGKTTIVTNGIEEKTFDDTMLSLWSNPALYEKKVPVFIMDVHGMQGHRRKSILQLWVPPVVRSNQVTVDGDSITLSDFFQLPTANYKLFTITFEFESDR